MARSLGTLTLDLVAKTAGFTQGMTKAERDSAKWRKSVERDAKKVGTAIGIGVAAAVTGLTALVGVQIKQADEARKTAQAVGLTTEAFTALTFAAGQSGVEQAKLTSGLSRFNRSILEAASGVATYKDSFDALGVTVTDASGELKSGEDILDEIADRFQDLPDGVAKSALALEIFGRAGAQLIPLLNSGSEGIAALTSQAEALGLVIGDETAKQAELFNDSLAVLGALGTGVGRQIAADLLPQLSQLTADLADAATNGDILTQVSGKLTGAVRQVAAAAVGVVAAFDLAGRAIGGFGATVVDSVEDINFTLLALNPGAALSQALVKNFSKSDSVAKEAVKDLDATAQEYADLINKILNPPELSGDTEAKITSLAGILESLRGETRQTKTEAEKLADAVAKQIEELQFQAETVGLTAEQVKIYKLETMGATEAQIQAAAAALETVSAYEQQAEAAKAAAEEQANINKQAQGIFESLRTEEEAIRSSYERRRDIILENTEITGNARADLLKRLEEKTNAELEELNAGFWERYLKAAEENLTNLDRLSADLISNVAQSFGKTIEDIVFDAKSLDEALYDLAQGFLRSTVNALAQLAAEWVAYQAVQIAVGKTAQVSSANTQIANAQAASSMAALNAFASTAAIPITGPVLAPAAAAAAQAATLPYVANVAASALAGIAHDGLMSVPQTGTYLLEKGERVTTSETSAKMDSMIDEARQGGMGAGVRIVNAFDTDDVVGGYMGSDAAERQVMNIVRRNQRTIRSLAS